MSRLRSFLNIERGEELPVLLLFIYLTLVFTAYIISKSVRDALFLDKFSAATLPYLYIGVALVIAVIVSAYIRLSFRFAQAELASVTLLFFMTTALLLWLGIRLEWKTIPVIYYMWVSILGVIVTAQVWTIATSVLTMAQAKRLFPLLCGGGVLGSMLGGMMVAAGVGLAGTNNLILATVILLGMVVPIVWVLADHYGPKRRALRVQSTEEDANASVSSVLKMTVRTRYLRLIAILLALSAMVTLITDFQFKTVIQNHFHSRDGLASFFGSFYAYVGLFSFVAQLFGGSRLFQRYGLEVALLLLPFTLLGGTIALVAFPTLLAAGIFLKGSEGILHSSIDKSAIEMLYIPIPQALKVQVKAVFDMLIQRFSDGLGGVLLLVMTQAMGFSMAGVGVFNMFLLGLWLWTARETRREYVMAIRNRPPEKEPPSADPPVNKPRAA